METSKELAKIIVEEDAIKPKIRAIPQLKGMGIAGGDKFIWYLKFNLTLFVIKI